MVEMVTVMVTALMRAWMTLGASRFNVGDGRVRGDK